LSTDTSENANFNVFFLFSYLDPLQELFTEFIMVCEIFYWRDVTACFTMTYDGKDFDIFVILFER
jgi:hypothetical protein